MPSPSSPSPLRVAVVGCGAVTTASLMPVLAGHDRIRVAALVDRDDRRARTLAEAYKVETVLTDMAALSRDRVDAVVLATPPAHHAPATLDLVGRGFHVFVEKPFAIRTADAEAMVRAADEAGVTLAVGTYRRLLPVTRLLRGLLESEMLGRPLAVDIEEGGEYTWDLATLSVLTREGGGGGVLIDLGTHLLDQLFFVVPGTPLVERYVDNARGGVETDCEVTLSLETRWGAIPARLELSRTRQLRGSVQVRCERGTFELMRGDFCALGIVDTTGAVTDPLTGASRPVSVDATWADEREIVGYKAFRAEFDDWLAGIDQTREPQLSGRSAVPVVRAIEACYGRRESLTEPWVDGGAVAAGVGRAPAAHGGARRRVLVTGAGGFLGCRTAECLHFGGSWDVRALVRRPASAARLARLPIDIVLGDVTSATDMAAAVKGCDAVVHCAVGTVWPPEAAYAVTVDGTARAAEASRLAGVARFVHISSMAVHGSALPPRLDESAALHPGEGFDYGRAKFMAEQAVAAESARGLRSVVLRPARIYGPYSRTFTVRPLRALAEDALVLSGDAESPANMVYVDNVVEAIVRALEADDHVCGEAFLVNDREQLSWRAFYEYFGAAAGHAVKVVPRIRDEASPAPGFLRHWAGGVQTIAFSPEVRALAKKVLWTDPVGTLPRRLWERSPRFQATVQRALRIDAAVTYREPAPAAPDEVVFTIDPTLVVVDKAVARLGFTGVVSREEAMALTLEWAKAARLLKLATEERS